MLSYFLNHPSSFLNILHSNHPCADCKRSLGDFYNPLTIIYKKYIIQLHNHSFNQFFIPFVRVSPNLYLPYLHHYQQTLASQSASSQAQLPYPAVQSIFLSFTHLSKKFLYLRKIWQPTINIIPVQTRNPCLLTDIDNLSRDSLKPGFQYMRFSTL